MAVQLATADESVARRKVREAYAAIDGPIRGLPDTLSSLLTPDALGAWRVIRDHDKETYAIFIQLVRAKCGRDLLNLLLSSIGPLRTPSGTSIQLLSPSEIVNRPAPVPLIEQFYPQRGIAGVYGESGSAKSFLVMDQIGAICSGAGHWHGIKARYAPAVVVQAEGTQQQRLRAWANHYDVELEDLPLRIVEEQIDLRSPDGHIHELLEAVHAAREHIGPVKVVVVDTLSRTFGGGNESTSEDMSAYVDNANMLAKAIDGLVIVIHHAGKDASRGARGHSSFRAALDAEIEVQRHSDGTRTARVTKSRDGVDGAEFSFRLQEIDLGPHPTAEGERLSSCVVVPSGAAAGAPRRRMPKGKNQTAACEVLQAALAEGKVMTRTDAVKLVQDRCGLAYKRAWDAVNDLLSAEIIRSGPMGSIEPGAEQ